MARTTKPPHLLDRVHWYMDVHSYGGVVHERLLAAIPLGDGLYAGMIFTIDAVGAPRVQFWERLDQLDAQGFTRIDPLRARGWCDVLPRFLERLQDSLGDA